MINTTACTQIKLFNDGCRCVRTTTGIFTIMGQPEGYRININGGRWGLSDIANPSRAGGIADFVHSQLCLQKEQTDNDH